MLAVCAVSWADSKSHFEKINKPHELLFLLAVWWAKKKNTIVSGNAGDEKNLHSGGLNLIKFLK